MLVQAVIGVCRLRHEKFDVRLLEHNGNVGGAVGKVVGRVGKEAQMSSV